MRAVHGTPAEFAEAVWNASDGLMISDAEADEAVRKYRREWAAAPEENPS